MGFRVVRAWAERRGIALDRERFDGRFGAGVPSGGPTGASPVGVLLPQTFMNRSGAPVAEAVATLPLEDPSRDLLVVVDDVDLPFGRLRLRPEGGSGGQKGLADVIEALGRRDFPRLRFGVARPPGAVETADWVLQPFSEDEEARLPARVRAACDAIDAVLAEGVTAAMNHVNRAPDPEGAKPLQ